MAHIMIEDSSPEAKKLLAYIRTLPYVTVIDAKKKGFAEEAAACNAVPVSVFTQNYTAKLTNTSTRMRKVAISETVLDKVSELRAFLTDELKLSRKAAHSRTARIDAFLVSLAGAANYPLCRFKNGTGSDIGVQYSRKIGFSPTKYLTKASSFRTCVIPPS